MRLALACAALSLAAVASAAGPETLTFPSEDGLAISVDLYLASEDRSMPFLVLFHQAGWSRGEYREIAPRLNALGFHCMAVDQRSGGDVNDVANETAKRAAAQGLGASYLDALPDLRAALAYAREHFASGPLLAWGSSYSAALLLRLAGDQPGLVDGVLAFAPGEYFRSLGKSGQWVREGAQHIAVPVFITSARAERSQWQAIYQAISSQKTAYLPETQGNHGSRALWRQFPDNSGYWSAVEAFLSPFLSSPGGQP